MNLTPRCACGIDVHAHVVPERFPAYMGKTVPAPWPETAPAPDAKGLCHRHVLVGGKHYRTVSEQSVPLQDIDAAVAELRHAAEQLGLVGVEVGSNINGRPIGDALFDPFFAACVALDLPVFVHALKPAGMDRLVGPAPLQQVLAFPTDVGLAAASVITGGLLQRHPALRMAFSHGGGTLAMLLPRLQQGWQVFPALAESIGESPREQARRLYFDTLVFDAPTLRHLAHSFGTSQLLIGTDHPFNFSERQPLERLGAAGFDAAACDAMASGNACRFLGPRAAALFKESA